MTSIKEEKENFILRELEKGERTGNYLNDRLISEFDGAVSKRFRNEVERLIKNNKIARKGSGGTAVFHILYKKKEEPKKQAAVAHGKPAPVPVVKKKERELNVTEQQDAVEMLRYSALNPDRNFSQMMKTLFAGDVDQNTALAFAFLTNNWYLIDGNVTKDGYQWLDNALAED